MWFSSAVSPGHMVQLLAYPVSWRIIFPFTVIDFRSVASPSLCRLPVNMHVVCFLGAFLSRKSLLFPYLIARELGKMFEKALGGMSG